MLGFDYQVSLNLGNVPPDSGVLVVTSTDIWFLNYYVLPRRVYMYPGLIKDEDVKIVPKEWLKEKGINYIFLHHPPSLRIIEVDKIGGGK